MRLPIEIFTVETVHRREINPAPYNPKVFPLPAQRKLAELLDRHGMVELMVWNRRTKHLVGGHMRLNELDRVDPSLDYTIDLAVVELDLDREMTLNVALSNPNSQGEYDADILAALIGEVGHKGTGFDAIDLQMMN